MRILFTHSNKVGSTLIKAFEGGKASHCAAVLSDNTVIHSTLFNKGVTVESYTEFMQGRILIADISFDVPDEVAAEEFLIAQIGKPYDWTAIAGFVLWRNLADEDSWYCSELLVMAAIAGGMTVFDLNSRRFQVRMALNIFNAWSTNGNQMDPHQTLRSSNAEYDPAVNRMGRSSPWSERNDLR